MRRFGNQGETGPFFEVAEFAPHRQRGGGYDDGLEPVEDGLLELRRDVERRSSDPGLDAAIAASGLDPATVTFGFGREEQQRVGHALQSPLNAARIEKLVGQFFLQFLREIL